MDIVRKLFGTTNLYEILQISTETVGDEKILKSAYLRAALKFHPDKGSQDEREERTSKFQIISQIFEMLKDPDLRKSYEETGEWPDKEELILEASSSGKLDEQTILEFKNYYLGSDEEREDVKRLYEEGKGDFMYVLDNLFFANILDDEERVQGIIDGLIEAQDMEKLGNGVDEKARDKKIKKARKEAAEADKLRDELNIGSIDGLKNAIAQKAAARSSFVDDLEKKYAAEEEEKNGKASGSKGRGRGRPAKSAPIDDDDEVDGDEVIPKAKKGRGRPAKSAPISDDDDEEETATPKAKKGRGRPAKSAPISDDDDEEEKATPKAKKGRGRPSKPAQLSDDDEEEKATPKAKKGRGRPPKVAHSDDDEADEDYPKAKKPKKSEPSSGAKVAGKKGRGRPPKNKQ